MTDRLPAPSDFASPPDLVTRSRWEEMDRIARPVRLARVRERFAADGLDAYFGIRPEHMRYLTGLVLGDGEEKVAGNSRGLRLRTETALQGVQMGS